METTIEEYLDHKIVIQSSPTATDEFELTVFNSTGKKVLEHVGFEEADHAFDHAQESIDEAEDTAYYEFEKYYE